ncbi:outer membrane assembly protein AsmA [Edwardsiella hoshinae]|uniref:Outer membrane assembly protein AsmA n=1 Tax=Edwardsiella hoshinae TaxID=93378 RepID=A0A376DI13_9GAMM|nr:outer membrane assembly protein AsmA [Edwardsiella hoshinae]AOV97392.1 outer membrane assembly protein AsmA [Edwardsiella hoshinae]QPR26666.1 outer membrane assembly protein AsmA [Edwardsiella hoshinae]STC89764.1 putative assembly protein [Edwardsiella hoshinae]
MRRLLTTLMILLVVVTAGLSALLLLIDPNDFRAYMVKQVQQRTGYTLTLDGDLRWRVWPQLSILSDHMSLRADGALQPVISADNMRLDVRLWPLLSHQLDVRQVMLKGAVIRLTPDSEPQQVISAPSSPVARGEAISDMAWRLNIQKVKVEDSLVIWQPADSEPINLRDIQLYLDQNAQRQVQLSFSSRINRDQRDLLVNLEANVDLRHYPQQYRAQISHFDYHYSGAGLPAAGIAGQGSTILSYQAAPATVTLSGLTLSANESQLHGEIQGTLGANPDYRVTLRADKLNWDMLSGWQGGSTTSGQDEAVTPPPSPVVSQVSAPMQNDNLAFLRDFSAALSIQANQLTYHGLTIDGFDLQASNRRGQGELTRLNGHIGKGSFAVSGTLQSQADQAPRVTLQPRLQQIALQPVLKAFALPEFISGRLSLEASLRGSGLAPASLLRQWQGDGMLTLDDARLEGLNIAQLVQQAVTRSQRGVQADERLDTFTTFHSLRAEAALRDGRLTLNRLSGQSALLDLNGNGSVDLANQRCDINLGVRVLQGWSGHNELVTLLQQVRIPLHIYGDWQQLNYQLNVEQALRGSLEQEARDALKNWLKRR